MGGLYLELHVCTSYIVLKVHFLFHARTKQHENVEAFHNSIAYTA